MNPLKRVSDTIVRVVDRYLPEPFVFAIVMTVATMALALGLTDSGLIDILVAWGDGLSMLLSFITQMALMILFAFALSQLEPLPTWLRKAAGVPKSPTSAYVSCTLVTGLVSLFSWPLGLIMGALYARELGLVARERGMALHYPLLAAAAFGGFVVWHMGYSASAPLFVATAGNAMESQIGGVMPVSQTIFAVWNVALAFITLALVAMTAATLHPRDPSKIVESTLQRSAETSVVKQSNFRGPADHLEHSRVPVLVGGLLLSAFVVHWFATKGLTLDLNIVNWTFLALGLVLAKSATQYAEAFYAGARIAAPTLLQYPFYGGIMGIMLGTGLVASIAPWFTRIATEHTLPVLAFLLAGLVNFFIPSGGAQWAVQGPPFIEAARMLGTELSLVVMGIAYGDQWTNIVHPFTVIPVALLTGLKARSIIAYSAVLFLVAALPLGLGLYLVSRFGLAG